MLRCSRLCLQSFFYGRSGQKLLEPSIIAVIRREVHLRPQPRHHAEPHDEHEVGISSFVANKILIACLLQMSVDDANDSLHLVAVALDGRRDFLGVEVAEPRLLAEVWTLSAHLEVLPGKSLVLLWERIVVEFAFLVVLINEIANNSTRLGKS